MTLCIAAHALSIGSDEHGQDERSLVLCCDGLIGDNYSTTETEMKCDFTLGGGVVALWAGAVDHIEDALRIYKRRFATKPLDLYDYKQDLSAGYDELTERLTLRKELANVDLIVAGFIEGDPKIVEVSASGVQAKPFFSTIGTGSNLADSILRWRNPNQYSHLHEVLYYVYEAKRIGEVSPTVGKLATYMFVLSQNPDGSLKARYVLDQGMKQLSSDFAEFGPRTFAARSKFPWDKMAPIKVEQ